MSNQGLTGHIGSPKFGWIMNSSGVFTNLFHEYFPIFFSVGAVGGEKNLLVQDIFFSQFVSWKIHRCGIRDGCF